jgi:hypothetical protein
VVAACARRAGVDVIVTWNVGQLERVSEGIEVKAPRA